jgi:HAD superfamily hydrolase (TIGR01509 family)
MAIAVLDIDGTLVDTNYQHALAWFRAFRASGIVLPVWRIHRHIGMGGDQLVGALTDERTERELGDQIRQQEKRCYFDLIGEVEPMHGARELIEELVEREHKVVLASSAKEDEVDHYLELLDARELADAWTTSADVEATKPAPDLVHAALERIDGSAGDAVMVGDTPWDVIAARRAGVGTLAVMTGGFAAQELTEAGATAVFESVDELHSKLDQTPFS